MDGVLVDGEPLHFRAINRLLAEEDRELSLDQYRPYMGTKAGWTELIADLGLRHPREHYSPRYHQLILDEYRTCSAPEPGATALVTGLRRAGMPIAVASSSVMPWVEACLERLDLRSQFDVLVSGSDVEEGKPNPAIYLETARRLGVDPSACLAFEDAPAGIESARRAGMTCWAVRTEYTRGLPLPNPDRELDSLEQVSLEDIVGVAA